MRTATEKNPVWFTTTRVPNTPGKWALRYRTLGSMTGRSAWAGDFDSREDAIQAGVDKGWVQVKDWKHAEDLAKPFEAARWAAFKASTDARRGMTTILFTDFVTQEKKRVWVTAERAAQILADLGEPNKYGVIE